MRLGWGASPQGQCQAGREAEGPHTHKSQQRPWPQLTVLPALQGRGLAG